MGVLKAYGIGARRERNKVAKNGMSHWKWACPKCGKMKKTPRSKGQKNPPSIPECHGGKMLPRRSVNIRLVVLKSIGFSSYKAYLGSSLWMSIRARVLAQKPDCEMCGKKAACVHHRSYDKAVLLGERDSSLTSLCMGCHETIEFNGDGGKRRHFNANYHLNRIKGDILRGESSGAKSPPGVIGFGVHKDRRWSEVPDSWLIWCRTNIRNSDIRSLVKQEIGARAFARGAKRLPATSTGADPATGGCQSAPWECEDSTQQAAEASDQSDLDMEFRQIAKFS